MARRSDRVHAFTNYDLATGIGISAPQPGADQTPVSREWLSANIWAKEPLGALRDAWRRESVFD